MCKRSIYLDWFEINAPRIKNTKQWKTDLLIKNCKEIAIKWCQKVQMKLNGVQIIEWKREMLNGRLFTIRPNYKLSCSMIVGLLWHPNNGDVVFSSFVLLIWCWLLMTKYAKSNKNRRRNKNNSIHMKRHRSMFNRACYCTKVSNNQWTYRRDQKKATTLQMFMLTTCGVFVHLSVFCSWFHLFSTQSGFFVTCTIIMHSHWIIRSQCAAMRQDIKMH